MRAVLADAAAVGNAGRVLAAEAAVAQQPVDVVEAAKAPEAELFPEEGVRCAMQEGIGLVGVLEEGRLVRVEPQVTGGWIKGQVGVASDLVMPDPIARLASLGFQTVCCAPVS